LNFTGVTLEQIAKVAKVHKMTVSRALRNHQSISQATRERIQKVAHKLGYQPNPLLSIYQAHVRSGRTSEYQATIGWISDHQDPQFWQKPWNQPLFKGAQSRAEELGYRLDLIQLDNPDRLDADKSILRHARVLRSRGIHGIVVPYSENLFNAQEPWPDLTVAVIGLQHQLEPVSDPLAASEENLYHTASIDYYTNMRIACERLRALGYRRIGLVISRWLDLHTDKQFRSSFLGQQLDWSVSDRLPIFFDENPTAIVSPALRKWFDRHRPDAVICSINQAKGWLEQLGQKVPNDIGLVHLNLAADVNGWSGIEAGMSPIGAAAVDLVVQQFRLNERGIPENQHELFIAGRWVSGQTTKQQNKTATAKQQHS
jgi:LacI family transcriptional regulator